MTKLRLVCAVATIVALSNLEMVHAGGQGQNSNNNSNDDKREDHKQQRRTAAAAAKRNQNARKAALAASSALKDGADNAINGLKATIPQEAAAKDNVNNAKKENEEKVEKIGEDIALLRLDDKMYWNRFLQNSGSAPTPPTTPTAPPPTNPPPTNPPPTNPPPVPTNPTPPVPTNPPPTNPAPVPTNPGESSFSFVRRTRRQRRVKKRNDSDA